MLYTRRRKGCGLSKAQQSLEVRSAFQSRVGEKRCTSCGRRTGLHEYVSTTTTRVAQRCLAFHSKIQELPPVIKLEIPDEVKLEVAQFLSLIPLARMDFRMEVDKVVTASDASGGGLTKSVGITGFGQAAAFSYAKKN